MAFSGLETLYQNLGPTTASLVAGNREADANYTQQLADQHQQGLIAKQQADAAQASQMNPLLIAQQQGANEGQGIKNTAGGLANTFTQQTQPGMVQGANAENKGKVSKQQLDEMNHVSEMAGQFATQLDQIPVLARPQVVQQYMQQNNVDPSGPIGSMLLKVPPQDLPGILKTMQQRMQQSAAGYREKMDLEDKKTVSAQEVAKIHAAASKYSADSSAAASRYGADSRAKAKVVDPNVIAAKLGFEKGAAYYAIQAENADDPQEKQQFMAMAQKFEQANLNQKNASAGSKMDLGAAGIKTNVVPSALSGGPKAGTAENPIKLN